MANDPSHIGPVALGEYSFWKEKPLGPERTPLSVRIVKSEISGELGGKRLRLSDTDSEHR